MTIYNPQDLILQAAPSRKGYTGVWYKISCGTTTPLKSSDSTSLNPATLTWNATYLDGSFTESPYPGYIKAYEQADNSTAWIQITSGVNVPPAVNSTAYTWTAGASMSLATVRKVRVDLYAHDNTAYDNLLASETIVIVQDGAAGTPAAAGMTLILSNQSHSVPTASDGTGGNYFGSGTDIRVYDGNTELSFVTGTATASATYAISAIVATNITSNPSGVVSSGTYPPYGIIGTASAMSQDAASIAYTITGKRNDTAGTAFSIAITQNFSKTKAGTDTTVKYLQTNISSIKHTIAGAPTPTSLVGTFYKVSGSASQTTNVGSLKIESTTDNTNYSAVSSSTNVSSISLSLPTETSLKAYKISAYSETTAYTTLIDSVIIPITYDGTNGTNGTAGSNGLVVSLTNDSHTIPCDLNGNNGNYVNSGTDIYVYEGATALTCVGTTASYPASAGQFNIVISTATGITTGALSIVSGHGSMGTLSAITADAALVRFAVYVKNSTGVTSLLTVDYTIARTKVGATGLQGNAYWLDVGPSVISKSNTGVYTPTTYKPTSYQSLAGAAASLYSARFRVLWGTDGSTYPNTAYQSVSDESTITSITLSTLTNVKSIKTTLYAPGGFVSVVDEEVTPIVNDGSNGTNGATGSTGAQKFICYAQVNPASYPSGPSGTATTTLSGSTPGMPANGSFGVTNYASAAWVPTAIADASIQLGYKMWQSDGTCPAGSTTITWGTPYLSSFKVGSLSAITANLGSVNISTDGAVASTGKTYGSAGAGFFLGYDGAYKLDVGDSSKYLRWDGSNLSVGGNIISSGNITKSSGLDGTLQLVNGWSFLGNNNTGYNLGTAALTNYEILTNYTGDNRYNIPINPDMGTVTVRVDFYINIRNTSANAEKCLVTFQMCDDTNNVISLYNSYWGTNIPVQASNMLYLPAATGGLTGYNSLSYRGSSESFAWSSYLLYTPSSYNSLDPNGYGRCKVLLTKTASSNYIYLDDLTVTITRFKR